MQTFNVAHLTDQGREINVIPLKDDYPTAPMRVRSFILQDLRAAVAKAGLTGPVAAIWNAGPERIGFIAPREWYDFFSNLDVYTVTRLSEYQITLG
jgi:hypothetical protein